MCGGEGPDGCRGEDGPPGDGSSLGCQVARDGRLYVGLLVRRYGRVVSRAVVDKEAPEEEPDNADRAKHVEDGLPAQPVAQQAGQRQRHHRAELQQKY